MSVRRLCALVRGLPPDSALHRNGAKWTTQHEIAALAVERADMWWQVWVGMNAAKGSKLPEGIGITHPDRPKPEREKRSKKALSARQIAGLM